MGEISLVSLSFVRLALRYHDLVLLELHLFLLRWKLPHHLYLLEASLTLGELLFLSWLVLTVLVAAHRLGLAFFCSIGGERLSPLCCLLLCLPLSNLVLQSLQRRCVLLLLQSVVFQGAPKRFLQALRGLVQAEGNREGMNIQVLHAENSLVRHQMNTPQVCLHGLLRQLVQQRLLGQQGPQLVGDVDQPLFVALHHGHMHLPVVKLLQKSVLRGHNKNQRLSARSKACRTSDSVHVGLH
mmetsp:Transcript_17284/g.38102  ORF Transcript_17284/g.38102 Transcript_17284/m.38102 type:complete len:240 (+) Transcript_17284:635-1354(+)